MERVNIARQLAKEAVEEQGGRWEDLTPEERADWIRTISATLLRAKRIVQQIPPQEPGNRHHRRAMKALRRRK